jgi:hypothetical protein
MFAIPLAFFLLFQAAQPGTITGRVQAVDGTPAVAVRVGAMPAPGETTRPSFGPQYFDYDAPVSAGLTDNQGRYRLTNVPPGRYFIWSQGTFYPTTPDADRATVLTVAAGGTIDNIDFKLMRQFGGKVSGRITPKPDAGTRVKASLSGVELAEVLEVPVAADGSFEFGRAPRGVFLIDFFPSFPGLGAYRVQVGEGDVTGLELVRPPTHKVSGKIAMQNGPIPHALLEFASAKSYIGARINPDGTFAVQLNSARHEIELAGMPVGYEVTSVRAGSNDVTKGLVVGNSDVSGVVINVAAPRQLPHLRGRITGLANSRLSSTKVEITGPIIGALEAPVQQDGSFEFAALTPGLYSLRLAQVPEFVPMNVVVTPSDADIQVVVPSR